MGSIAKPPPSFSLKRCIALFPGMLENGERNSNLAKTTGAFLCKKKHKLHGVIVVSSSIPGLGAFSSPCVVPRLRIHQSTFAMSLEQSSALA